MIEPDWDWLGPYDTDRVWLRQTLIEVDLVLLLPSLSLSVIWIEIVIVGVLIVLREGGISVSVECCDGDTDIVLENDGVDVVLSDPDRA